MKNILEYYNKEYDKIKEQPDFQFGSAQSFISELLSLPPAKRFKLLPLFKKIEEETFDKGFVIPNLNYKSLETDNELWKKTLKSIKSKKEKKIVDTEDDFNKVLYHLTSKYEHFFKRIKGYYIFRLENADSNKTNVLLLHDEDFEKHPEMDSFETNNSTYEINKFLVSEFDEIEIKISANKEQKYIAVLLITPNLQNNELLLKEIKNIFELFDNRRFIAIKKIPITTSEDYKIKDIDIGFENLENYSNKIFNNRDLTYDEEIIIKKLFDGEMILDYKILKSGNSGSKVIEIQPLKVNSPKTVRSVVKFSKIDSERKIKSERKKFRQNIIDFGISSYTVDYEETYTHEAIKYNYASSDSKKDSYQFSKLIAANIKRKYNFEFTLENVINELFNCEPYKIWDDYVIDIKEPVAKMYDVYLKSEKKVFEAISLIKNINVSSLENIELIKNYLRIKEYNLKTKMKICHGDLHSENFFKDEKGVYLIDFGWTGRRHSLIDYVTLECSLKFKHLPLYIPIEDLLKYEINLLTKDSFSTNFNISFIKRTIVSEIFSLILQLREKSKEFMFNKTSPLEYLIALFIISFRQIQYPNLNQNYAIHSAEMLSEEIVKEISKQR